MVVTRNGTGFSEEQQPFAEDGPGITSRKTVLNPANPFDLTDREQADSSVISSQYEAFYAIYALWLRRRAEGMTQRDIAAKLERDPAWVSRALSGPKNWTMRTLGELAHALDGHVTIRVEAVEDFSADTEAAGAEGPPAVRSGVGEAG